MLVMLRDIRTSPRRNVIVNAWTGFATKHEINFAKFHNRDILML